MRFRLRLRLLSRPISAGNWKQLCPFQKLGIRISTMTASEASRYSGSGTTLALGALFGNLAHALLLAPWLWARICRVTAAASLEARPGSALWPTPATPSSRSLGSRSEHCHSLAANLEISLFAMISDGFFKTLTKKYY